MNDVRVPNASPDPSRADAVPDTVPDVALPAGTATHGSTPQDMNVVHKPTTRLESPVVKESTETVTTDRVELIPPATDPVSQQSSTSVVGSFLSSAWETIKDSGSWLNDAATKMAQGYGRLYEGKKPDTHVEDGPAPLSPLAEQEALTFDRVVDRVQGHDVTNALGRMATEAMLVLPVTSGPATLLMTRAQNEVNADVQDQLNGQDQAIDNLSNDVAMTMERVHDLSAQFEALAKTTKHPEQGERQTLEMPEGDAAPLRPTHFEIEETTTNIENFPSDNTGKDPEYEMYNRDQLIEHIKSLTVSNAYLQEQIDQIMEVITAPTPKDPP